MFIQVRNNSVGVVTVTYGSAYRGTPPHANDWRMFFEGTRLAMGDSGDITVQGLVHDVPGLNSVVAKARDRQAGQFCRAQAALFD